MQYPDNYKLFYNPIWFNCEERIVLACAMIPENVTISNFKQYEPYLEMRYLQLAQEAFDKHGYEVIKWYHEFIDINYFIDFDVRSIVANLMDSDKYFYMVGAIKESIDLNVMPDYIIGTDAAFDIMEGQGFYEILYFFYVYF
jgi:hypothetical protein